LPPRDGLYLSGFVHSCLYDRPLFLGPREPS
jgi:hypothetical protein